MPNRSSSWEPERRFRPCESRAAVAVSSVSSRCRLPTATIRSSGEPASTGEKVVSGTALRSSGRSVRTRITEPCAILTSRPPSRVAITSAGVPKSSRITRVDATGGAGSPRRVRKLSPGCTSWDFRWRR